MTRQNEVPAKKNASRGQSIREIIDDLIVRRTSGEMIDNEAVIAAHPDLMPDLANALRNLQMVECAEQHAKAINEGLHIRCPHCRNHIEIVDDASLSDMTCPSCGSHFSLVDDSPRTYQASSQQTIGHFQLLDKVGVGAYGSVWSARDAELDRTVAVKIPRKGQLSPEDGELFIREARAAAQLKHPHIVNVLEVGRHEDRIYIVTDFVQGLDLADWLTDQQATPFEAAELCATMADALQHAHDHGVIHRDLKPSNIMLDTAGEPHLMDFGLAKREAGEMTMTVEGKLLGTPAYMPPEQARGSAHDADARSDIYSLGVILFELLTGERPFRGSTRMLLHQVLVDDAPSPRQLNQGVPRDLDTICLKCLEKDPARRYQTAADLRDDLKHFLAGEPVLARPITRTARAWRWSKRKPVVAGLSAAVASLLLFLGIAGPVVALRQAQLARNETEARNAAAIREQEAEDARRVAERAQRRTAEEAELRRRLLYTSDTNLAMQAWEDANVPLVLALLDRQIPQADEADLRGFEWYYLRNLCVESVQTPTLRHSFPLSAVAYSPRGNQLATAGTEVTIWENGTAWQLPKSHHASSVEFSSDGKLLLVSQDNANLASLWNLEERKRQVLEGHSDRVTTSSFSPDGRTVATGSWDNSVRQWDVETCRQLPLKEMRHDDYVNCVAFSPDGRLLASGGGDATVRLWDAKTGDQLHIFLGHKDTVATVAFSLDGATLITGSADHTVKLWNVDTRILKNTLHGHLSIIYSIALSPDGMTLASGSEDRTVRLWNVAKGEQVTALKGHANGVSSVMFSPDGKTLASASFDGTVKLWDVQSERRKDVFGGGFRGGVLERRFSFAPSPDGTAVAFSSDDQLKLWDLSSQTERIFPDANIDAAVAFSPDGTTLVSASRAGTLDFWDAASGMRLDQLTGHEGRIRVVAFSPDGERLASAGEDHIVRLWHAETRELLAECVGHTAPVGHVIFSPDSTLFASGSDDDTVRLWDANTGKPKEESDTLVGDVNSLAFSPDGKVLAMALTFGVMLWDLNSGVVSMVSHEEQGMLMANDLAFSPDGQLFALATSDEIQLWDARTRKNTFTFSRIGETLHSVTFLSETILASGSRTGQVRLWRAATGKQLAALENQLADSQGLKGHWGRVRCATFSPDGRLLASGSRDRSIILWDVDRREELHKLLGHTSDVFSVAFSPNGRQLASGSNDSTVRVWDLDSGKSRAELPHKDEVFAVLFSHDGKTLASACRDSTITLWDVDTLTKRSTLNEHTNAVRSLALSPDGRTLISSSYDATVRLWEMETGALSSTLKGHNAAVKTVACSPDGRLIASGSDDGTIQIWSAETRQLLDTLEHDGTIRSVAFSADSNTLFSASYDATVRQWDIVTGEHRFIAKGIPSDCVSVSADGKKLATTNVSPIIRLFDLPIKDLQFEEPVDEQPEAKLK